MIVNGKALLAAHPMNPMHGEKRKDVASGTSYGLSEAGYDVRLDHDVTLSESNRFVLSSTYERFEMPNYLMAVVHDKSTHARRRISVFNTVIEPGWSGWLTLEIVYHGTGEIIIPKGAGIAQVIFHTLTEPANYGDGKYQNQERGPQEART